MLVLASGAGAGITKGAGLTKVADVLKVSSSVCTDMVAIAGEQAILRGKNTLSLRKHAYSNTLKILQPQKNFSDKKFGHFSYIYSKHRLYVLIITASAR